MQRRLSIILTIMLLAGVLSGCGSSDKNSTDANQTTDSQQNVIELGEKEEDEGDALEDATIVELGNEYSTANDIVFSLFKIITADKLKALEGGSLYYEADNGNNYVDVIINLTNNGTVDQSTEDIEAFFLSDDGNRYDLTFKGAESNGFLSQYSSISPLSTQKIHIGYQLPTNVQSGKAYFKFGNDLFVVDYDASVEVSSKISLELKQEVIVEDTASFKLTGTEFTDDLVPPDTSNYYWHYPVNDPSKDTYLAVYCNLTNYSSSNIRADNMITMKAIFDGKYEYESFLLIEDKDKNGFGSYEEISPLDTRRGIFLFEVPKKVQDMDVELLIYFYGNEYSVKE